MTIIIDKNYGVSLPEGNVLGYVGEHLLRYARVIHPEFLRAIYGIRLDYGSGQVYDCLISGGVLRVTGSLLAQPGTVKAQFFAEVEDEYGGADHVFESEVFELIIGESISNDPQPIPTYEQSQSILMQLKAYLSPGAAEVLYHIPYVQGYTTSVTQTEEV